MSCLLERKAQIIFITASSMRDNGKKRKIVVESRPEFAIVRLEGSKERFPISWEMIYEVAKRHHLKNLELEAAAEQPRDVSHGKVRS
jgi:hypothetical protein